MIKHINLGNISICRPLLNCSSADIAEKGISAIKARDLETLSYCWAELSPERRSDSDEPGQLLENAITEANIKPIQWLERAATVTGGFTPETKGNYNVYIILLARVKNKYPGYALYVGQSFRKPKMRYKQHIKGYKASRWVRNYGICLLPSLYEHLNKMTREEAEKLEVEIAKELKKVGIPTYGGH